MDITATTKIGELTFAETNRWGTPPRENVSWNCRTPLGRLSVLRRDLGLEMPCHDTESGFADPGGEWWYRPSFDVRRFPYLTIAEAIDDIKRGARDDESDDE